MLNQLAHCFSSVGRTCLNVGVMWKNTKFEMHGIYIHEGCRFLYVIQCVAIKYLCNIKVNGIWQN